jgi:phosphatidylserine/phosphatidylglycerophosphate/cardiolipin synthase-like enzyme
MSFPRSLPKARLKRPLSVPLALVIGLFAGYCFAAFGRAPASRELVRAPGEITWSVYFSPHGGCTEAIIRELDVARTSVYVQAYSFTSVPIAQALVRAYRRGVRVEVILDKEQRTAKYSEADFLTHQGVPTFIDDRHAIAHNKVMIIDETTVITGSFNFSKQAETSNAENLLVLRDRELASRYFAAWQKHRAHSDSYKGR